MTTPGEIFVQYDDMSYMGLWCQACLDAGLAGKADLLGDDPANTWNVKYTLDQLNKLAAGHVRTVHAKEEPS